MLTATCTPAGPRSDRSPTSLPAVVDNGEVIGYAALNLVITAVDLGLAVLGHCLRSRRQARSEISLDTANA